MSFFRKVSAAVLAAAMLGQSQAFAAVTLGTGETHPNYASAYEAPEALKKIVRLDTKVVNLLDKAAKKEIAKIKDPKVRKYYSEANVAKKAALKSLFSELRSSMKYEFMAPEVENARDMLKIAVKGYSEFIGEIKAVASGNSSLSAEEKASVEAEIVNFQKDLVVKPLNKILDAYAKSDLKETGEWKMSFDSPYGKVNASMDRYTSILSILGMSQEADFVLNSDFDLDLPGPVEYDSETYERVATPSTKIKGTVSIDANVKVIDGYAYANLRNYSLNIETSATGSAAEEFNEGLAKAKSVLELAKGKTVKIAMPEENAKSRPEAVLKRLSDMVAILGTESVLTPSQKIKEGKYALALNGRTLAKLATAFDQKLTVKDLNEANADLTEMGLGFEKSGNASVIRASDSEWTGDFSMTRTASEYAMNFRSVSGNSRTSVDVSNTEAKFSTVSKTATATGTWKENGALDVSVKTMGIEVFKVSGTLLLKKADLAFVVSGKEVATVKFAWEGESYYSDIRIDFDIPEGMSDRSGAVSIRSFEKGTIEKGNFNIEVPKDVVDIETLMK